MGLEKAAYRQGECCACCKRISIMRLIFFLDEQTDVEIDVDLSCKGS